MKVFLIAAMGAALLAGCAPFEHGHYANDVSYKNTAGDPPGTPLVYRGDDLSPTYAGNTYQPRSRAQNRVARLNANRSYPSTYEPVVAEQPYLTRARPTVAPVQTAFVQPTYAPQPTYNAAPVYSAPVAYAPAVSQSFAAPTYAPPVQPQYRQPAQQSTYAASPAPSYATTFGSGIRFDAEGYAICDIPGAHLGAAHAPHY